MSNVGRQLLKAPTGIQGLDEITGGGLPRGRTTLVCGGAGCGKTLLAIEFLVRGATQFAEPGVFMAFEETASDLTQNVASLGFDLDDLVAHKQLVLSHVRVERGSTPRSLRAIADVRRLCEEHLYGRYDLEVIDLYQQPQLAEGDQIIAAPTLIKKLPLPLRRIIGDMSRSERVLVGLDLRKKS